MRIAEQRAGRVCSVGIGRVTGPRKQLAESLPDRGYLGRSFPARDAPPVIAGDCAQNDARAA